VTGCDRIIARLADGPATAAELYATTYSVVHSRIAELRKRGHVIECEHVKGETGASSYIYRLVGEAGTTQPGQTARADGDATAWEAPRLPDQQAKCAPAVVPRVPPRPAGAQQLSLLEAA